MMSTQDFPPPTRVSKTAYVQRIRLVASGWPSHATAPRAFDLSAVGSASLGQGRIEAIEERPLAAQDLRSAAFQCVCPAVGTSTVRPQQSPSFSDRDGIGPRATDVLLAIPVIRASGQGIDTKGHGASATGRNAPPSVQAALQAPNAPSVSFSPKRSRPPLALMSPSSLSHTLPVRGRRRRTYAYRRPRRR